MNQNKASKQNKTADDYVFTVPTTAIYRFSMYSEDGTLIDERVEERKLLETQEEYDFEEEIPQFTAKQMREAIEEAYWMGVKWATSYPKPVLTDGPKKLFKKFNCEEEK